MNSYRMSYQSATLMHRTILCMEKSQNRKVSGLSTMDDHVPIVCWPPVSLGEGQFVWRHYDPKFLGKTHYFLTVQEKKK